MQRRKGEALNRLDHDELLMLARQVSKTAVNREASAGDLAELIRRSLSAEEIRREVRQIAARRRRRKRWGNRLASRRATLGLMLLVVVASSLFAAWLGSTPPQHYLVQNWERTWGEEDGTAFFAGAVDAEGNLLVAGSSRGCFLAKFSPTGVEEWRKNFTVEEGENANVLSISIDASSRDIYLAGVTVDHIGVADKGFLMGFDSIGEPKWLRVFGSGSIAERVAVGNGTIHVAVSTSAYGGVKALLARYDSDGNELWNTTWGGIASSRAWAVAVDDEGNALLTGYFNASSMPSVTDFRGFLVKFDPAGKELWNATLDQEEDGYGRLVVVADEYAYVLDDVDALRKYDAENGGFIWRKPLSWSRNENYGGVSVTESLRADAVSVEGDGSILAAGAYRRYELRDSSLTCSYAVCVTVYDSNGEERMNMTSPRRDGYLDTYTVVLQRDGGVSVVGWVNYPGTGHWESVLMVFGVMDSRTVGAVLITGPASVLCITIYLGWKSKQHGGGPT